jgi:hypothetical protein
MYGGGQDLCRKKSVERGQEKKMDYTFCFLYMKCEI